MKSGYKWGKEWPDPNTFQVWHRSWGREEIEPQERWNLNSGKEEAECEVRT